MLNILIYDIDFILIYIVGEIFGVVNICSYCFVVKKYF